MEDANLTQSAADSKSQITNPEEIDAISAEQKMRNMRKKFDEIQAEWQATVERTENAKMKHSQGLLARAMGAGIFDSIMWLKRKLPRCKFHIQLW